MRKNGKTVIPSFEPVSDANKRASAANIARVIREFQRAPTRSRWPRRLFLVDSSPGVTRIQRGGTIKLRVVKVRRAARRRIKSNSDCREG